MERTGNLGLDRILLLADLLEEVEPHLGGLVESGCRRVGRFDPRVRELRALWSRVRAALNLPPVPLADEVLAEGGVHVEGRPETSH